MTVVHEKQAVALSSVYASLLLSVAKLVVGIATGSLGVLSEAAHSLMDFGATLITYFSVSASDRPADKEHPYGHGKIESISALIETGLLFITSIWILKEAFDRLLSDEVHVRTTWYAVAVILFSITVDYGRARALRRVAEQTGSHALEADALHFGTDILSSLVVLAGLGFVAIGWPKADAVAAIGVAGFVFWAGLDLSRRTLGVLLDTAPEGVAQQAMTIAQGIPGVVRIDRARARPTGNAVFIELAVRVSRTLSLEQVEAITNEIRQRIRTTIDRAQPLVHARAIALDDESILDTIRVVAARNSLSVHDIAIHRMDGENHINLSLEVSENLTISEAHDIATFLEEKIRDEMPERTVIHIRIEPSLSHPLASEPEDAESLQNLESLIRAAASRLPAVLSIHDVRAQRSISERHVSFHCVFDDDLPIRRVHAITTKLEQDIRDTLGSSSRIIVHPEAVTAALHHEENYFLQKGASSNDAVIVEGAITS